MYYVYFVRSNRNRLYIGCTRNLLKRLARHVHGSGAAFVQTETGLRIVYGARFGYFADPDGYLWKVASATGQQPFAE